MTELTVRGLARAAARLVALPLVSAVAGFRTEPGSLYCVYRARNAESLQALLVAASEARWNISLWALDEEVPALRQWTRGCGPGTKFGLYNKLLAAAPPKPKGPIVFSDDDIRFERGDVVRFAALARFVGFALAQPAHDRGVNASHDSNVRVPGLLARVTDFVEIGPLFAVAESARHAMLPFPADAGMGWGLEFEWAKLLLAEGRHVGVVDQCTLAHLEPVGVTYSPRDELPALQRRIAASGIEDSSWRGQTRLAWWAHRPLAPRAWREDNGRPRRLSSRL